VSEKSWLVFQLSELLAKVEPGNVRFHEFLRTPSLSCSVYHIPKGSREMASAHEEDELYFVLRAAGVCGSRRRSMPSKRAPSCTSMRPATTPFSMSRRT